MEGAFRAGDCLLDADCRVRRGEADEAERQLLLLPARRHGRPVVRAVGCLLASLWTGCQVIRHGTGRDELWH